MYNKKADANRRKYMAKFKRFELRVTPELAEKIKQHAESSGDSVNQFLTRAALEAMERDNIRG